ncbi:MAG: GNAT family N-acetyltransferase [Anaerolineales bacterium]|nr:GNAT family N-acetyltransferase [Anaerolineales bacterium]
MMNFQLDFRPISEADLDFLYQVYASTRQDELDQLDWTATQKAEFLQMQFTAQHRHYQEYFPEAEFQIILVDGRPAGRLYLSRWETEFRIIDIALLPAVRGQGIGTTILRQISAEAEAQGLPVRIHVEQFNPALNLYLRLGFRKIGEQGVYFLMERVPVAQPSSETNS